MGYDIELYLISNYLVKPLNGTHDNILSSRNVIFVQKMTSTTSVFFVKITGGGRGGVNPILSNTKKKIAQITDICFLEIYLVTMTILKP